VPALANSAARAQVVDSFVLKLLAVEAAILIIVGLVAVIGHDDLVSLLSH
jgi:hypothetical protein